MFRAAFDESHAAGKSATGHSPAVAAVKVLTQVIKTSKGKKKKKNQENEKEFSIDAFAFVGCAVWLNK